jgi:hypothetical protein
MAAVASAVAALRAAASPLQQEGALAALHAALLSGDAAAAAAAVAAGALVPAVAALRDERATAGARAAACGALAAALHRLRGASPGLAASDRALQRDLGAAVVAVAAALRSRGGHEAHLRPAAVAALRALLEAHPPNAALALREGAADVVRALAADEAAEDAAAVLQALEAAQRAADDAEAAAAAALAAARCGSAGACAPGCACAARSVRGLRGTGLLGTEEAPGYLAVLAARSRAQADAPPQ